MVVRDVTKLLIFDEIDEARQVVKDGCQMVLDLIFLEKPVVLHGEKASMERVIVGECFWLGLISFFVCSAASFFSKS